MIFVFLLLEGIEGSRRNPFPSALRRSISKYGDVGHMFTRYSSSCPYSNANRCNVGAGTLFSRSKCEWLEYFEECGLDESEKCYGFFKDQKNSWSLEWYTCDETIMNSIRDIFPGVHIAFEREEKGRAKSCLPRVWYGPETCDKAEEQGYNKDQFLRIDCSPGPCKEVLVNWKGEQIGTVINRRGNHGAHTFCARYLDFKTGEEKIYKKFVELSDCPHWM